MQGNRIPSIVTNGEGVAARYLRDHDSGILPVYLAAGRWDLPGPAAPETYLYAVATQDGLRLDEHLSELLERLPMAQVLEEVPAYQANM